MRAESHRKRFPPPWKLLTALAVGLLLAGIAFAQSGATDQSAPPDKSSTQNKNEGQSSEPATTRLKIRVTSKGDKPVSNASVYVRFNKSGGLFHHDKLAELSFKTNEDGSVKVPPVPQGKILIQVVAKGWHTYGQWYEINKDEETIQIVLEPPPHWY